jgi:tripartite ATP-independent transporter DctM subunit
MVLILARKRGYPVEEKRTVKQAIANFRASALGLLTPIIIIGGIMFGLFTPTEASIIAVLYALFLGFVAYGTLKFRKLFNVFRETARLASLSLFCVGTAGVFGWMLAYYQVPQQLAEVASGIQDPAILLLAIGAIFLIFGTFLDGLVVAIIIGPLFMPAIETVGIHPVQYGLVATVAVSMGLVTPPYGLCLLLASTIGEVKIHEALPDTLLLLCAMTGILVGIIFIPELTLFIPRMIAGQWM